MLRTRAGETSSASRRLQASRAFRKLTVSWPRQMNLQQQLMVFRAEKHLIQTQREGGWSGEGRVKQSQYTSWRTASPRLSLNVEELAKQKKRTEKRETCHPSRKRASREMDRISTSDTTAVSDDIFKQKVSISSFQLKLSLKSPLRCCWKNSDLHAH